MSKKTFIHAENNHNILSSNEVRFYNPPKPEELKVIIWGKELCNGAEWNDFLKCVEDKTKEIDQLKQQLAETEQRFLEFQEDSIRNEQIYVRELAEKDKEIERLKNLFKLNNEVVINQGKEIFDLRVQVLQQKQNQTQLAIQELEKVKEQLDKEIMIMSNFDEMKKQLKYLVEILVYIQQRIKELKGEKDVED